LIIRRIIEQITTSKERNDMSKAKKAPAANIIWFEIPADNPERASKFYGALFGWKITPFPGMTDYWHIETGGGDDTPDGGLMVRKHEKQPITNYVNVPSVTRGMAKVKKLGGTVCKEKTAVPHMGYFAICRDTEGNEFALWEINMNAK
jgi:predicted enzyme related to lactoylglutathione lyase